MADWIRCRSATNPNLMFLVNLDNVVRIAPVQIGSNGSGSTLQIVGSKDEIVVGNQPDEIMTMARYRNTL